MTKEQKFITFITDLNVETQMPNDVKEYWLSLKQKTFEPPTLTENGMKIIQFLQENLDTQQEWTARDIAEGIFLSPRSVSGAMRKLVTDGFVNRIEKEPIMYSLSDEGKNIVLEF